jgi:ABC-type glutathione transport system ATPase component
MAQFVRDNQNILLDVQNLSVVYDSSGGEVYAVNDVSFQLRHGEILGLAGESGSGKSTLAYAIARLQRPPARTTAGRVLYYPRASKGGNGSTAAQSRKGFAGANWQWFSRAR